MDSSNFLKNACPDVSLEHNCSCTLEHNIYPLQLSIKCDCNIKECKTKPMEHAAKECHETTTIIFSFSSGEDTTTTDLTCSEVMQLQSALGGITSVLAIILLATIAGWISTCVVVYIRGKRGRQNR